MSRRIAASCVLPVTSAMLLPSKRTPMRSVNGF